MTVKQEAKLAFARSRSRSNDGLERTLTDDELWEEFSKWHTEEYKWTPRAQKNSSLGQWDRQREWKAFRCAFRLAESLRSNVGGKRLDD